jgi:hypothetical protein
MKLTNIAMMKIRGEYSIDSITAQWVKVIDSIKSFQNIKYDYAPHHLLLKHSATTLASIPLECLPVLRERSNSSNVLAYSYYDTTLNKISLLASCNSKWLYNWSIKDVAQLNVNSIVRECYCLFYCLLVAHTLGATKLILVHPYRYPYEVCSVVRNSMPFDKELTDTSFELIKLFKGFEMEVTNQKLIKTHFQTSMQCKTGEFYYFKN